MSNEVILAIIGVAAALLGSLAGGLTSYFATRSMRRLEWQLSARAKEIDNNRALYNRFLTEANRLMLHSIVGEPPDSSGFSRIAALESQVRMISLPLGDLARKITICTMTYHEKVDPESEDSFANLRDRFIADCRDDLEARIRAKA